MIEGAIATARPKRPKARMRWVSGACVPIFLLAAGTFLSKLPRHPEALIRITDPAGNPIPGAMIAPYALRPKPGPYSSGHYGWNYAAKDIGSVEVKTDERGCAYVPYPKYVFEKIETGQITFTLRHPDFVPDNPSVEVTIAPPTGAPGGMWLAFLKERVRLRKVFARPDPVAMQKGAILSITVTNGLQQNGEPIHAQVSSTGKLDWQRPGPGVLVNRQISPGGRSVRVVQIDSAGDAWFSEIFPITAATGQTNSLQVSLTKGVNVRGQISPAVPRPIKRGRVIAHVWPPSQPPPNSPPQWHAWTPTSEDGTFDFRSLPPGELEITAICDGFISTSGPGSGGFRYPQKYKISSNNIAELEIGMEPTTRLEVRVLDQSGKPISGATVSTWPNVQYGQSWSTIFASDCYNTADDFKASAKKRTWSFEPMPDFTGTSDLSGWAVLANLPIEVQQFAVNHPDYQIPAVQHQNDERKDRHGAVKLIPGVTNKIEVRVEPRNRSQIAHY